MLYQKSFKAIKGHKSTLHHETCQNFLNVVEHILLYQKQLNYHVLLPELDFWSTVHFTSVIHSTVVYCFGRDPVDCSAIASLKTILKISYVMKRCPSSSLNNWSCHKDQWYSFGVCISKFIAITFRLSIAFIMARNQS